MQQWYWQRSRGSAFTRASRHYRSAICGQLISCPIAACDPAGRGTVEASRSPSDVRSNCKVRRQFSHCFHRWSRFLALYELSATNEYMSADELFHLVYLAIYTLRSRNV